MLRLTLDPLDPLDAVDRLPGLGPTSKKALAEHGVRTVADLVWTQPVGFDDLRAPISLKEAIERQGRQTFAAVVVSGGMIPLGRRRGIRIVLRDVDDEKCKLHAFWFFTAHGILAMCQPGVAVLVTGRVVVDPHPKGTRPPRTTHPDVFADAPDARVARPRYPRLGPKGAAVRKAIAAAPHDIEPIPAAIAARERMPPAVDVVCKMHAIAGDLPTPADHRAFLERLAWAEAFTRAWERLEVEEGLEKTPAFALKKVPKVVAKLEKELGFAFTGDQKAAIKAVAADLTETRPMRRLLLGDVGTGKTAVALAAIAQAVAGGKQAAILAPTTVLAEQYVAAIRPLEAATDTKAVLITAGQTAAVRKRALEALASGTAKIAIGTHALLGDAIAIPDLALVIVDEQQRLGVAQRLGLVQKGARPHLLTLTATPIPRTLALALRGELATTVLRERPAGRKPVATSLASKSDLARVVEEARAAADRGERVFWVVPRIDDGDEDADDLASLKARVLALKLEIKGIGEIHGAMKPADKSAAMRDFRSGATRVLVGTTVVEVGVDVPEATLMVIEDAEQHGLATLHQLRGRVGRGDRPGRCILLHGDPLEGAARRRLEKLRALDAGEDVAKADMEIRGSGDLGGTRQHGDEEPLLYLDPAEPWPWLDRIEADARALRATDKELAAPENRILGSIVAKLRRAIAVREEAG